MKKSLFLFFFGFFAISFATSAYAQQMMIGVRGGVNLAGQQWTQNADISWHPGLLAGGQFDYRFNNSWELSFELLYDQKGAHADMYGIANGPLPSGKVDWTGSYLEIPFLAKESFGSGNLRPYIFGGPSIGFLLSNIEKHETGFDGYPPNATANITDSTVQIDFSIVAGAGISLTLPSGTELVLDAGYAFGLTNTDNYYYDKVQDLYIYSRDIRLAAGVLFPLN